MTDTFEPLGNLASKIVDRWDWWRRALTDLSKVGSKELPVHESHPQQGYYRSKAYKDGPLLPVAIWFTEEGDLVAYRNGKEIDPHDIWTYCCRAPVTVEEYDAVMAGGNWSDEPPIAKIGDNSGSDDPFEALNIEFEGEKETAEEFLKKPVKTQTDADKVGIWAKRLSSIKSRAEDLHRVEKQPNLLEGRRIDDKWRGLKTDPDALAKKLKQHTQPFLTAKKREEEDRARKEAEKAAELRRKAAEDAKKAEDEAREQLEKTGEVDLEKAAAAEAQKLETIRQAQQAEASAKVKNASAGRTGSKISVRTEMRARIVDYDKAHMALKGHKEMKELVATLAQRAVKAGVDVDGVEAEPFETVV
jgi:hypothetical protein